MKGKSMNSPDPAPPQPTQPQQSVTLKVQSTRHVIPKKEPSNG